MYGWLGLLRRHLWDVSCCSDVSNAACCAGIPYSTCCSDVPNTSCCSDVLDTDCCSGIPTLALYAGHGCRRRAKQGHRPNPAGMREAGHDSRRAHGASVNVCVPLSSSKACPKPLERGLPSTLASRQQKANKINGVLRWQQVALTRNLGSGHCTDALLGALVPLSRVLMPVLVGELVGWPSSNTRSPIRAHWHVLNIQAQP